MPEFRSLASILLQPADAVENVVDPIPVLADDPLPVASNCPFPDEQILLEIRLFRAHLRETLDRAVDAVLGRLARDILARELLLAPAEIAVLLENALRDYEHIHPLRARVHPEDVPALSGIDLPVFADETLARGDAFLDLRSGSIDLTLTSRLDDLLATATHP